MRGVRVRGVRARGVRVRGVAVRGVRVKVDDGDDVGEGGTTDEETEEAEEADAELKTRTPHRYVEKNKTNPRTRMHFIRKDVNDSCQRLWYKLLAATLANNIQ